MEITKEKLISCNRIVTHNDFDGLVSGAILSKALNISKVIFASPGVIENERIIITEKDIVCDLPYSRHCGVWFDHHEGNLEQLDYLGIDKKKIFGKFELKPSCARVVLNTLEELKFELPEYLKSTVIEADKIDSFGYSSIEEWRMESPSNIVNNSLKVNMSSPEKHRDYLYKILKLIREHPLEEVASVNEVKENYQKYKKSEERMLATIKSSSFFHNEDTDREVIILDLTIHPKKENLDRRLAFLLYPEAKAVLCVYNLFDIGQKTTDLGFSMSLSIVGNNLAHNKDIGEIMRSLNIGDGHRGAASGIVRCKNKKEMLNMKEIFLREIIKLWKTQS